MTDFYTFSHLSKEAPLLHAISKKNKNAPYHFSLALHTGEDPHTILANRSTVATQFTPKQNYTYILAQQTHSDHITIITSKETKGWSSQQDAIQDCDAMITDIPSVILGILTADCVPILLYDKKRHVIAAIHAGWKGTKAHISTKTVQKMIEVYDCHSADILAGIAPSIGACCYEVGDDVAQHFSDIPHSYTKKKDTFMLDLPFINTQQLLAIGILEENIEMSHRCTACEIDSFFSYRKEKGCSGRFISMIGLKA